MDDNIAVSGSFSYSRLAFVGLMAKTEELLNAEAYSFPERYRNLSASNLEKRVCVKIKEACSYFQIDADSVCLVSGQRFPDIVVGECYGVEVKSTKEDHWTTTGSSIIESTRVDTIKEIYLLFGKLGGVNPEFRCRPYSSVLSDIAVTHSPRYLVNMDLQETDTIFHKMGTTYEEFRKSPESISVVRKYYLEKNVEHGRQEMPWWITTENIDNPTPFTIKLWNSIEVQDRRILQAKCMILFPEALNPARSMTKYNNTTLWLCSYNQVLNPNIRDMYSAGGKITHVNGRRLQTPVAQVFNVIVEYADIIREMLQCPTREMLTLVREFNASILGKDMYGKWLSQCEVFAREYNVPIVDWVREKPMFTFSK